MSLVESPSLEWSKEDVCEVPLDQNAIWCGRTMPGRATPGQERRTFSPGCLRDDLRSDPCILSHWFKKRRSLAFGSVPSDRRWARQSSDCLQPVNRAYRVRKSTRINEQYQRGFFRFKWTMRVVALIVFAMLAVANPVTNLCVFSVAIVCNDSPADYETTVRSPKRPRLIPDLAGLHQRLLARGIN